MNKHEHHVFLNTVHVTMFLCATDKYNTDSHTGRHLTVCDAA